MPPLPHHRAYGSVPRRFGGLSACDFLHGDQAKTLVSGGENPRINGDEGCGRGIERWAMSAFCGEGAPVLAAVQDAARRCAVAFGPP